MPRKARWLTHLSIFPREAFALAISRGCRWLHPLYASHGVSFIHSCRLVWSILNELSQCWPGLLQIVNRYSRAAAVFRL